MPVFQEVIHNIMTRLGGSLGQRSGELPRELIDEPSILNLGLSRV